MMLGKRSRPPYSRTKSMTRITVVDVGNMEAPTPTPTTLDHQNFVINESKALGDLEEHVMLGQIGYDQRSMAMLSRGAGDDHIEPAHFLRTCGLCNRGLATGRDIYMYRGDSAFCSLECREEKMKQDERKEKCKLAVSKTAKNHHNHSQMVTAASEASSESETIRAA